MATRGTNRGYSVSDSITTSGGNSAPNQREKSQYDGLWLNPTVTFEIKDEDGNLVEEQIRFPRGVALSDIADFKIYPNTPPERAKLYRKMNTIFAALRAKGLNLDEGDNIRVKNVDMFLYRRQEVAEHVTGTEEIEAVEEMLFDD